MCLFAFFGIGLLNSICVVFPTFDLVTTGFSSQLATKMFRQLFWMRALKQPTPKRTVLYSNSATIAAFGFAAKLTKLQLDTEIKTTDKYTSKDGKKRYKGNKNLKSTQFLDIHHHGFEKQSFV